MSKKKKRSRFGSNVVEAAERHREKKGRTYAYLNIPEGLDLFKVESDGRVKFDIIPYIVSDERHPDGVEDKPDSALVGNSWWRRPISVHRNVGVNNASMICPGTIGEPCPICEYRKEQLDGGMEWDDPEVVKGPSDRSLYLVIPKDHKHYEEEIHLWDYSDFLFYKQLDQELKEDSEYGTFPDLEEGWTLKTRFTEESIGKKKKKTNFYKANRIDFVKRDEPYDEDMDKKYDLDELMIILSYKKLNKAFLEIADEGERKPKSKKGKKPKKGKKSKKDKNPEKDKKSKKEEDKSRRPRRKKSTESEKEGSKSSKKDKKNECPAGYKFGKDYDDFDECDKCKIVKACEAKKDELDK